MEKHEGLPRLAAVISLRSQSVPADVKPRMLTKAVNNEAEHQHFPVRAKRLLRVNSGENSNGCNSNWRNFAAKVAIDSAGKQSVDALQELSPCPISDNECSLFA